MNRNLVAWLLVAALVGTVFAANWAIERWGIVPVGFGLYAPAAVYFAGLAFTLRDLIHHQAGRPWVAVAILLGAAASYVVSPAFALASAVAFLVSELCDWAVYEPVRKRGWMPAVLASNAVGIVVDSVLFLWLAFGSLDFLAGQVVGKMWVTLAFVAVLWGARAVSLRRDPV